VGTEDIMYTQMGSKEVRLKKFCG